MEEIINNAGVQIVLAIITLIEFTVGIISYFKISKVRKSQTEYRDIVELDHVLHNLNDNTDLLATIRTHPEISLPPELNERINKTVDNNHECIGAVNKANQILLNSENLIPDTDVIYHDKGYFNNAFYTDVILNAKRRVVFFIKRNTRPFTLDNLNALINLADMKNVKITLFTFSPEMEDAVLREMMKSIPKCPPQVEELRSAQITARQFYLNCKKQMKKPQNITCYEYRSFPLSQYIVVDNKMYWGIVNYNKAEMTNVFEDRPYLEMDVSNPFARYILSLQTKTALECEGLNEVY